MRGITVGSIPPQPTRGLKNSPLHLRACPTGKRILYPSSHGVVCRALPGEATFQVKEITTCIGNKRPATAAAMTQKVFIAGDEEGFAHVWTRNGGAWVHQQYTLSGMKYVRIADVAISPDSQRAVLVGVDKYCQTFGACIATNGGNTVGKIEGHKKGINSADFSPVKPYTIATGGADGVIGIFNGPPYKLAHKIVVAEFCEDVEDGEITCVRYNASGTELVATSDTGVVCVFDALERVLIGSWQAPDRAPIRAVAWRWSGTHFATVSKGNIVRVFELNSGKGICPVDEFSTGDDLEEDDPRGVIFPRCGYIAVACAGGHIKGWKTTSDLGELTDKQLEKELEEQKSKETDEEEIVYDAPGTVFPYRPIQNGAPEFVWYGPRGGPTCVAFDQASDKLIVGTSLGYLIFLTTESGVPETFQVNKVERDLTIRACIINGKLGGAITQDGLVRFYRVRTSNIKSGDGAQRIRKALEKGNDGKSATTFSSNTKSELSLAATHDTFQIPTAFVFIDHGKYAALFLTDGLLNIYGTERALAQTRPEQNMRPDWSVKLLGVPECVSVTEDGTLLAVALQPSADYPSSKFGTGEEEERKPTHPIVEIYEVESGKSLEGFQFIFVRESTGTSITAIALNSEGSLLAYADSANQIWVIEVESQKPVVSGEWDAHTNKIHTLNWAPNGNRLLSVSTNEMLVWNINQIGEKPQELKVPSVPSFLFARFLFNNVILSGGTNGLITVTELVDE